MTVIKLAIVERPNDRNNRSSRSEVSAEKVFIGVLSLSSAALLKKETLAQVFSCEF